MKVPVYNGGVPLEGVPGVRQSGNLPDFMGGNRAVALAGAESAAKSINQAAFSAYQQEQADQQAHYQDQLQIAKKTRVLDASNQLQLHVQDAVYGQNGYLNKRGQDAFLGSDGKSAADLVYEDVAKRQADLENSLGDDEQKALFKQAAQPMLLSLRGQVMGHEAQQHRVYTQSTLESSIAVNAGQIELNYNNPELLKGSIGQIKAAAGQLSSLNGFDQQWADVHAQNAISQSINKSLDAALTNNDHNAAMALLHQFTPEMTQEDLLRNYGKITKAQNETIAVNAATQAIQTFASRFEPQESDRLANLITGKESGGNQWGQNGSLITSPKGATGKWQIMPQTAPEAAKLAGLPWDKELFNQPMTGDPQKDARAVAYNAALGKAYFTEQLKTNNGDIAKALAAYNAGPGALANAVKQADKSGGHWLTFLPQETQDYVQTITKKYADGEGRTAPPTLKEAQDQVLSLLPAEATQDQRQTALQEVTRQFNVNQQAIKQRDDFTTAEALRKLEKNGGDYMALPLTLRNAIPPEDLSKVQNFAKAQHGGERETNLQLYNNLAANPHVLKALTEDEYYKLAPELSVADFKHFAAQRAALLKPSPGDAPDSLDTGAVNTSLNNLLNQLGIDPSPKDSDVSGKMRVGAIRQFVNNSVLDAQAQAGRRFKDSEINNHLATLFAKSTELKGFFTDTKKQTMAITVKEIPTAELDQIKAAFVRRGIDNPTEGQLLQVYLKGNL